VATSLLHECVDVMIALYLPLLRPAVLDRARALLAALGPTAVVVSPHAAPAVTPARWVRLADPDPAIWRRWVSAHRPDLVVVDGSGPHTRAAAGLGSTVAVVVRMDGAVDGDLGAAYSEADIVLAPWPAGSVVGRWPARWQERTLHLGALGWQAASSARRRPSTAPAPSRRWDCVVLSATGAGPGPRERRAMMAATSGWHWTCAPDHALLDDGPVWDALWRSAVVVCAPTPANIAAVAAARKPTVLVLGTRSPGQEFLADAARGSAPVLVRDSWPSAEEWRPLLDRARQLDGDEWRSWSPEPGLRTLADLAAAVPAADASVRLETAGAEPSAGVPAQV
jgi:hypothetical protein